MISANRPQTIEELRESISSELEGNPPLWITRKQGKYGVEVYINNAKILLEQSNFQSKLKVNGDTMTQVSEKCTNEGFAVSCYSHEHYSQYIEFYKKLTILLNFILSEIIISCPKRVTKHTCNKIYYK